MNINQLDQMLKMLIGNQIMQKMYEVLNIISVTWDVRILIKYQII